MLLEIIKNNIADNDTIFVFPTEIASAEWAEEVLRQGVCDAISMERFIAWDTFKGDAVKSTKQNFQSIPSALRKMFATNLIHENATLSDKGNPLFKSIIKSEYANNAYQFSNWISSILPSLALLSASIVSVNKGNMENIDDEDKDLLLIKDKYTEFLESFNLFEPAWEKPPFCNNGKKYIIIYPEILEDYIEYENILTSINDIQIVHIPTTCENDAINEVVCYSSARTELRKAALHIRNLHDNMQIPFTDIAVSLPEHNILCEYVEREFALYDIPLRVRTGKPLASRGAGMLFSLLNDCESNNYSFQSLKNLLLDNHIPWLNPNGINLKRQLIDFGIKKNCLYSFHDINGKNIDIWESSFSKDSRESYLHDYYKTLRQRIHSIVTSSSFAGIRSEYMRFRDTFINWKGFSQKDDLILGRCISELGILINIEEKYPTIKLPSPYSFFVSLLNDKIYQEQTEKNGVSLFPYQVAAIAPFKHHLVLNVSQKSVSVIYRQLSFLRQDKRERLNFKDIDVTKLFLNIYSFSSGIRFSASEQTFSGFVRPNSALKQVADAECDVGNNVYVQEKKAFLQDTNFPTKVSNLQKIGFKNWSYGVFPTDSTYDFFNSDVILPANTVQKIKQLYFEDDKVRISATSLDLFFECPRQWLFSSILSLKEENLDASLIKPNAIGIFYHGVIEKFLKKLKSDNEKIIFNTDKLLSEKYNQLLDDCISFEIDDFKKYPDTGSLAIEILKSSIPTIKDIMKNLIIELSFWFDNCTVYCVEQDFSFPVSDNSFLYGRIDCAFCSDQGDVFIVDFKSKDAPSKKSCIVDEKGQLLNHQMACYTLLLEKSEKQSGHITSAIFVEIKKAKLNAIYGNIENTEGKFLVAEKHVFNRFSESDISFNNTMNTLFSNMQIFSEALQNGILPKSICSKVEYKTCIACKFRSICRTYYTVGALS